MSLLKVITNPSISHHLATETKVAFLVISCDSTNPSISHHLATETLDRL